MHVEVLGESMAGWRNGNALVSGARDSGFESQACRFLATRMKDTGLVVVHIKLIGYNTIRTVKPQSNLGVSNVPSGSECAQSGVGTRNITARLLTHPVSKYILLVFRGHVHDIDCVRVSLR